VVEAFENFVRVPDKTFVAGPWPGLDVLACIDDFLQRADMPRVSRPWILLNLVED
jgi:hypothetical protein